jgi:hypothetical protein
MAKRKAPKEATKKKAAKRKYTKNPSLHPAMFEDVISALVNPKRPKEKANV